MYCYLFECNFRLELVDVRMSFFLTLSEQVECIAIYLNVTYFRLELVDVRMSYYITLSEKVECNAIYLNVTLDSNWLMLG